MNKIIFTFTTLLFLLHGGGLSGAQVVDRPSLTIFGITPGASTFADVLQIFGKSSRWHTGDASTSESKMCYRLGSGSSEVFVVFASNSEMAGAPNYIVTGIRLYSSDGSFQENERCKSAEWKKGKFLTSSGLQLGISLSEVNQILGKEHRREGDNFIWSNCEEVPILPSDPYYEFWSKKTGCFEDEKGGWDGKPYYYSCSQVSVCFKDGKVIYLGLSSVDSIC